MVIGPPVSAEEQGELRHIAVPAWSVKAGVTIEVAVTLHQNKQDEKK
jgi:hypothetical protein